MTNIRYYSATAFIRYDEIRHPQIVMQELGIKYKDCKAELNGTQWIFIDCDSIPAELPSFLIQEKMIEISDNPTLIINGKKVDIIPDYFSFNSDDEIKEMP